jgi:hypothetical protein
MSVLSDRIWRALKFASKVECPSRVYLCRQGPGKIAKQHAKARFGHILMARQRLATRPLPICHNTALRRLVFSQAWPFGNIAALEGPAKFPELAFEPGPDAEAGSAQG